MFKTPTTFVIGAGASAELGLPLGAALKDNIVVELRAAIEQLGAWDKQPPLTLAFEQLVRSCENDEVGLSAAVEDVCQGLSIAFSIDNFLEAHADNKAIVDVGKLGIAQAILRAEAASNLLSHQSVRARSPLKSQVGATWYRQLAEKLFSGVHKSKVSTIFENVSFVIFNYDRCLETHLFYALKLYYRLSDDDVLEVLSSARFLHPYGDLGCAQNSSSTSTWVPYGKHDLRPSELLRVSSQIRTFCEQSADEDRLHQIRQIVSEAHKIIFLGFAFHDQNIELLSCEASEEKTVIGTAFNVSKSDQKVIERQVRNAFQMKMTHSFEIADMRCYDFFSAYSKSIS